MSGYDDDDEMDQPDPILRAIGPSLVGRVRSKEIGVFASIETQNLVLDVITKSKNPKELEPLKQIYDETKVPRARAHKLDRLVSDRIAAQERGAGAGQTESTSSRPTQPEPVPEPQPSVTREAESHKPSEDRPIQTVGEKDLKPTSKRKQSDDEEAEVIPTKVASSTQAKSELVMLSPPEEYRLRDRFRQMGATVRVRAEPSSDGEVIGQVTASTTVLATGITPTYLRIQWGADEDETGWVMRAMPDGEEFFAPVVYEDVETFSPAKLPTTEGNKNEEIVKPPAEIAAKPMRTVAETAQQSVRQLPQQEPTTKQALPQQMITVPAAEFYRLVDRVQQLEDDLRALRQLLRSA